MTPDFFASLLLEIQAEEMRAVAASARISAVLIDPGNVVFHHLSRIARESECAAAVYDLLAFGGEQ